MMVYASHAEQRHHRSFKRARRLFDDPSSIATPAEKHLYLKLRVDTEHTYQLKVES